MTSGSVAIKRVGNYSVDYELLPLSAVAGKTRVMEHILEQDIRKGYSVVAIDPKGDIGLFSKITQLAEETDRLADLLGADPSVVAGWINGEGRPDLASAISIIGLDEASRRPD